MKRRVIVTGVYACWKTTSSRFLIFIMITGSERFVAQCYYLYIDISKTDESFSNQPFLDVRGRVPLSSDLNFACVKHNVTSWTFINDWTSLFYCLFEASLIAACFKSNHEKIRQTSDTFKTDWILAQNSLPEIVNWFL